MDNNFDPNLNDNSLSLDDAGLSANAALNPTLTQDLPNTLIDDQNLNPNSTDSSADLDLVMPPTPVPPTVPSPSLNPTPIPVPNTVSPLDPDNDVSTQAAEARAAKLRSIAENAAFLSNNPEPEQSVNLASDNADNLEQALQILIESPKINPQLQQQLKIELLKLAEPPKPVMPIPIQIAQEFTPLTPMAPKPGSIPQSLTEETQITDDILPPLVENDGTTVKNPMQTVPPEEPM